MFFGKMSWGQDYFMILKRGGLTTKPFAHCVSFGLFYFNPLRSSKLDACLKIKKPWTLRVRASMSWEQDYFMILKGGGLTTKPFAHFVSFGLLFFHFRLQTSLQLTWKNKSPDASHQGFVVAGAGLFYDPERGGLNNEASVSLRSPGAFIFYSMLTIKLDACHKIKKPWTLRVRASM